MSGGKARLWEENFYISFQGYTKEIDKFVTYIKSKVLNIQIGETFYETLLRDLEN